ncbi:MAG: M3 family oligoendopeptidase, partial [Christensenellaceae bacterium]|nr:M3 family oligoendopeptidase [Christensenellaceae bacterium]
MKFSEMTYTRPDIESLKKAAQNAAEALAKAASAEEQIAIYRAFEKESNTVETMATLAYIRHTINTKDEFYEKEQDWLDEIMPELEELNQMVSLTILASPFRAELEAEFGSVLFTNMEIAVRSFKPELMPLMVEENRLSSEYQKLYASAMVEFDGKTMPLPMLGP